MNKVSRSPLGAPRPAASVGIASLLRAHVSLALAFALLASLAPLGAAARAQGVATKAQFPVAEDVPTYVIHQMPNGDVSCRIATPNEIDPAGDGTRTQPRVHQINHLQGKESAGESVSAGLTIVLRGTDRLELPENAQAKQAFIAAAAKWEELIASQIRVVIDVDYGPDFFGQPYSSSSTLGATSSGGFIPGYATVRNRLANRAPAGSEEAALLNNLPATSLPTDIGDVSTIFVPTSMMRALGLLGPTPDTDPQTAPVPRIGFNSNFSFDFDHTNGVVGTDFDSVAVHEIGHALGFTSQVGARELNPSAPLRATVWDMFRFRPGAGTAGSFSAAPRVLSSGVDSIDPHVYFGGAGELALSTGKPDGTGGDDEQASHWKDDRFGIPFIGIMDPTLPRGRHEEISANDLRAIDFFGYTLGGAPPPPPPPAPANNNFASAQSISGSSGRVTGTNVGATKEAGEPSHSDDNDPGGKSVWYAWTAPSNGSVNFNTGPGAGGESPSNFDTVLAAYTGSSVGALTPLAKDDDVDPGVVRTSTVTFNVVGGTTYRIAVDGWEADEGGIALNWSHTSTGGGGQPSVVSFSSHAFAASETGGAAVITLIRSNPEAALNVGVRTMDNSAAVACNDTTTMPGVAFARCDYATTLDTVTFAPGESTRTISVPLIDDSYGEPSETVDLELAVVPPAQMGVVPVTRLTITSNEAPGQDGATNPVNGVPFFVRQHYLDFLSREPEAGEPWSAVLNNCPDQLNSPACDRLTVSEAFFGSPEFALKARYAFRFYKVAYGRLPEYSEIVVDMRQLAGATGQEVIAKRAVFPGAFVLRTQFTQLYNGMSNQQFVDTLMNRYNLQSVTGFNPTTPEGGAKITFTRAALVASLNGGTFTRAQVLRAVADSDEVTAAEFRPSFVAIQYYGYLRRTPETTGYNNWLAYLNANPNDSRTMVNGFLNSAEYRLRFGRN